MARRFVFFLVFLLAAAPAEAAIYVAPTWDNLLKTLIRYGAIDMSENRLLDEYAMVTDCDIYRAFHNDDFKWNQVRESMRQSMELNLLKYPTDYAYEDTMMLGKYDFDQQVFNFSDKNPLFKVNAFFLFRSNGHTCHNDYVKYLPRSFRAVLSDSVTIPGLPLTQRSADALLRRMMANNNKERAIYVRFNLHINYISKLVKSGSPELMGGLTYTQAGNDRGSATVLTAQIDTIDFFEDEQRTKLLYSYQM